MSRGPDPRDAESFGAHRIADLRRAVHDLSWLLTRGYAVVAAVKLVGDHLRLDRRQRLAVRRGACTDEQRAHRRTTRVTGLAGRHVAVDGFNVIIGLEKALGGGVLFRGRDGALRDLGEVHGTWRRATSTDTAIARVGEALKSAGRVTWWLDEPVSNSGRLAASLRAWSDARGADWVVEVVRSPDALLRQHADVVATGDGPVLDDASAWVDLVAAAAPQDAWVVDLAS